MLAKKLLLAVVGIWCCLSINPANATYQKKGSDKVSVELFTNFDKINPEQNWEALLKFSLHDGWHIYSQDENNIGLPTTIKWQMPLSFELIDDKWSNDEEFVIDDIVQRGYGKTAYYKATIKPSADVYKTAKLEIEAAWLACNEECQPESAKFYLDLPMTEHNLRPSQTWLHELQKAEHHFSKLNHKNVINIQIAVLMALYPWSFGFICRYCHDFSHFARRRRRNRLGFSAAVTLVCRYNDCGFQHYFSAVDRLNQCSKLYN